MIYSFGRSRADFFFFFFIGERIFRAKLLGMQKKKKKKLGRTSTAFAFSFISLYRICMPLLKDTAMFGFSRD